MSSFAVVLPGLEPTLQQLSETPAALLVKTHFPHFQVAHLISLFLLGGCAILLNLRLMGVGIDERVSVVERGLRPALRLSVGAVLVSGLLIAMANPLKLYVDTPFLVKMIALVAALLVTFSVTVPLARADGAAGRWALAGLAGACTVWIVALCVFAFTSSSSPGVILIVVAAGLLSTVALEGRARWACLAGLGVIVGVQQIVTHAFIHPDDIGVLDPVNTAFTWAEALWILGFGTWLVGRRSGRRGSLRLARLAGCVGILTWVTVAAAGRWIAFG